VVQVVVLLTHMCVVPISSVDDRVRVTPVVLVAMAPAAIETVLVPGAVESTVVIEVVTPLFMLPTVSTAQTRKL
jgi:hypothetical protein